MPIGKDSIRKRVIGSDCAACGECTDKAPLAEKTTVSERAPLAGKAPAAGNAPAGQAPVRRSPGRPRKTPQTQTAASGPVAPAQSAPAPAQKPASAPAVTESVLTNVSTCRSRTECRIICCESPVGKRVLKNSCRVF